MATKTKQGTVEWFTELVEEALSEQDDPEADGGRPVRSIETYENSGLLTRDKGFVVKLEDGTEIQVTLQVYNRSGCQEEEDE